MDVRLRAALSATIEAPVAVRRRDEVPRRYRWNLTDVFPGVEAWEAAFRKVEESAARLAAARGTLGQSAKALLDGLTLRDETFAEYERVLVYAGLSYHEDMSINEAQGRHDRAETLGTRVSEAASWMMPELLTLPRETVAAWMEQNAALAVYRHAFDDIHRQAEHVLSTREEELLAMAGDIAAGPETIYSRFTNTNLDFPVIRDEQHREVRLSQARYAALIYSPDRRVRRDAFLGLHQTYADKANTLSALLSAQVKQHMFFARARRFGSCLEAALHGPNIPLAVYDNLIDTVNRHANKLARYVVLRKRLLKLDAIHAYDLYVPLVTATEQKIPYEQAAETIQQALGPLGADYVSRVRNAFESRWIDVYETRNKRSGAYSWGAYLTHPYLLLNYNETPHDQSTIAHELGHAMHSVYTTQNQPVVYGDYATFCAEVASTVNEVLLADHLLAHAPDDTQRLLILQQQIDAIRTTVFRQTLFAEFERDIHGRAEAGEALTGDVLCSLYRELVRAYYGSNLTLDDCGSAECLRIPHFYRNFYVYAYATSHCAAVNIARRILAGEPGAAEGLTRFLSAGSSRYPLDVLRLAGVDMTTSEPIEDTMKLFEELVGKFEALYAKTFDG